MQLTLTAGARPAFLSKNYVGVDSENASDLVASTGQVYVHRLYDMDRGSYWISVGSSDIIIETITIGTYEGALQANRSVDFFALMGINLKRFILEYSNDNGATYTAVPGADYSDAGANYTGENLILSLSSPVELNKLRLTMYTTQTANAEKQVAEVIAALGTLQLAKGFSSYEPERADNIKTAVMGDGSLFYRSVLRSDNSAERYRCAAGFRGLAAADRTSLRTVKTTRDPVLWYPEPGDQVGDIFQGRIAPNSFQERYLTMVKSAGYAIDFDFEETGGA